MIDKRSVYERCSAELEMARTALDDMTNWKDATDKDILMARAHAKRLEIKLAAARLAQAEFYLDSLKARIDYLEARLAKEGKATETEQAELAWAREAVLVNSSTIAKLAEEQQQRKKELELLLAEAELAAATNKV
ncbi:MAG TPA: hypothetical protein VNN73_17625 [Blastocatellia bacterium]|nr:hypothetical protein [Blastocatellia bacterium]